MVQVNSTVFILFQYVFPLIAIVASGLLILLWLLMPRPAKTLFKARFRSNPVVAVAFDDGLVRIVQGRTLDEGVIEFDRSKYRLIPRPPAGAGGGNPGSDPPALYRRFYLDGVNRPFYLAYSGKAVAVNPETVAGLQGALTTVDPKVLKRSLERSLSLFQIRAIAEVNRMIGRREAATSNTRLLLIILLGAVAVMLALMAAPYIQQALPVQPPA